MRQTYIRPYLACANPPPRTLTFTGPRTRWDNRLYNSPAHGYTAPTYNMYSAGACTATMNRLMRFCVHLCTTRRARGAFTTTQPTNLDCMQCTGAKVELFPEPNRLRPVSPRGRARLCMEKGPTKPRGAPRPQNRLLYIQVRSSVYFGVCLAFIFVLPGPFIGFSIGSQNSNPGVH